MNTPAPSSTLPGIDPDLGYFLISPGTDQPNGPLAPTELHVVLRPQETDDHFDPAFIHLPVTDHSEGMRLVTLGLSPTTEQARQVGMGRIVLTDEVRKHVHLFSFGGQLTVSVCHEANSATPSKTEYILTSSAPILILSNNQRDTTNQLAQELEATLARIRAGWGLADTAFWRRLAQVDPTAAFVGGLKGIWDHYASVSALGQEFPRFADYLRQEQKRLTAAGLWSAETVTLADLLAPDRTS